MDRAPPRARAARSELALRLYFFASFAALGVYSPSFPRWLVARGIEGVAMGAVIAALPAMAIVGPPLVGFLADAVGVRGSLLTIACLGSFLAFAVLALAGLGGHRFTAFEVLAVVVVFAAFRAPMLVMADVVAIEREQETGASYGNTRLWGSVGFLVATVAGGRFVDVERPAALPGAVAMALFVALIATLSIPVRSAEARSPFSEKVRSLLRVSDYLLLLGVAFVAELAISSSELCLSLYLSDLGVSGAGIGVTWALGVAAEIPMMAATAVLLARLRAPLLVVIALGGVGVRCVLLATLQSPHALMALQVAHSPCVALLWTAALVHVKDRVPRASLATAQGLFSAVTASGAVVGMLLWGASYGRFGGRATFGAAALVAAFATLFAVHWAVRAHRASASPASPQRGPIGPSPTS